MSVSNEQEIFRKAFIKMNHKSTRKFLVENVIKYYSPIYIAPKNKYNLHHIS